MFLRLLRSYLSLRIPGILTRSSDAFWNLPSHISSSENILIFFHGRLNIFSCFSHNLKQDIKTCSHVWIWLVPWQSGESFGTRPEIAGSKLSDVLKKPFKMTVVLSFTFLLLLQWCLYCYLISNRKLLMEPPWWKTTLLSD